jgi:hypothetical protein
MERTHTTPERPRTAMNCITNTHTSSIHRPQRTIDKKRRLSAVVTPPFGAIRTNRQVRAPVTKRQSLNTPWIPSQILAKPRDVTIAEIPTPPMFRRGLADAHPHPTSRMSLIQARRRRGYSDSSQFLPLHIHVPPPVPRSEPAGSFENPRKAPLPHGLKFNTTQSHRVSSHSSTLTTSTSSTTSDAPSTPLTTIGTPPPQKN